MGGKSGLNSGIRVVLHYIVEGYEVQIHELWMNAHREPTVNPQVLHDVSTSTIDDPIHKAAPLFQPPVHESRNQA